MSMLDIARTINLIEGGSAEPGEPEVKLANVRPAPQVNAAPPAQPAAAGGRTEQQEFAPR